MILLISFHNLLLLRTQSNRINRILLFIVLYLWLLMNLYLSIIYLFSLSFMSILLMILLPSLCFIQIPIFILILIGTCVCCSLPVLVLLGLVLSCCNSNHSSLFLVHYLAVVLMGFYPSDYLLLLLVDLVSTLTILLIYLDSSFFTSLWPYFLFQSLVTMVTWILFPSFGLISFLLYMKMGVFLGFLYLPYFYSSLSSLSLPIFLYFTYSNLIITSVLSSTSSYSFLSIIPFSTIMIFFLTLQHILRFPVIYLLSLSTNLLSLLFLILSSSSLFVAYLNQFFVLSLGLIFILFFLSFP